MKLLWDINLSKLAILKILLILTILSALFLIGTKKNVTPTTTKSVSKLFQRSEKKFSGPIAMILRRS